MASILECRNLSKTYGPVVAIDQMDLVMGEDRIVGLLGPNGSGKTTLMKLAAGLLQPTSGEILVAGQKVGPATKALVSYLPDQTYLPASMNSLKAIEMFKDFYSDFDAAKAMEMIKRLGIDPNMRFKALSKGNKEKIQLILVMSRNARLFVLDEPIGGVDPATRDFILQTIVSNHQAGSSVLISTHLVADVEPILDDVVMINSGRVVYAGGAEEMRRQRGKTLDAAFREEFRC
ncbi:MAG: ABC transporter ATP-binding protein [Coriobacteriales bacterium]|nr:ABC transporter ATP-binding protein [Coriobacteriales bacterium]